MTTLAKFALLGAAYFVVTLPVGYIIGRITKGWRKKLEKDGALKWAGTWIGYLERLIILTFVLRDQYEAIGLLIAAKSLLRFRDTDDARPQTEYVLIGTLASVAGALLAGEIVKLLFNSF